MRGGDEFRGLTIGLYIPTFKILTFTTCARVAIRGRKTDPGSIPLQTPLAVNLTIDPVFVRANDLNGSPLKALVGSHCSKT